MRRKDILVRGENQCGTGNSIHKRSSIKVIVPQFSCGWKELRAYFIRRGIRRWKRDGSRVSE